MKRLFMLVIISFIGLNQLKAQLLVKLDYFTKVPVAIKNCGALYTYDTTAFAKKKYIMLADFQNKGLITIGGKQISLTLTETKLVGKTTNVTTYNGSGYLVILSTKTVKQTSKIDTEEGTLEISRGKDKSTIKIHGQSGCDSSKEESN